MARVAVVGAGRWGRNLVRNFHALGALGAVCDQDPGRLREVADDVPDVRVVKRFEDVLAAADVDALAIATPAESHFPLAAAALRAGKHVLVEKPLALAAAEGEALCAEAERASRVLLVGHVLEYHGAIIRLEELLRTGALGDLLTIRSQRLNLARVRREASALWSFAPHDVAVILRLAGRLPLAVSATGASYLEPGVADVTSSTLLFSDNVQAHIHVSWLNAFREQRFSVVGSRGMIVFDDVARERKLVLFDHPLGVQDGEPVARRAEGSLVDFPPDEPLREECRHFLECVAGRAAPRTGGPSGVRVLRVLEAAQRSLERRGEPVPIEASSTSSTASSSS